MSPNLTYEQQFLCPNSKVWKVLPSFSSSSSSLTLRPQRVLILLSLSLYLPQLLLSFPIHRFPLFFLFLFSTFFIDDHKMKCFFFKEKSKSAPELQNQTKKKTNRATNSTGSVSSSKSVKDLYKEKEHSFRVFTLQELREATNGFNRMQKIGEGGFGSVYKGSILPPNRQGDPIQVAIKRLNTRGFQVFLFSFCSCGCFYHTWFSNCLFFNPFALRPLIERAIIEKFGPLWSW